LIEQKNLVKMIFIELDLILVRHKTITPMAITRKNTRRIVDSLFV